MLLFRGMAVAQIPVELFAGDKKATLDVLFFKFFKNNSGENSRFLFFNRNRASVDYKMTSTTNLPQFGFTEAVSYNHKKLKGFAPVVVGQIFNAGLFPKAGIQYAYIRKNITVFSWMVTETLHDPRIDLFFLGRFTPKLSEELHLFSQLELVNTAPTSNTKIFSFIQRLRLGLKMKAFQFGLAAEFSQNGRNKYITSNNIGGFLRYEY
ncbi:MAG: hypothetical protein KGP35_01150 [Bacteroidetes bacterium]|nr:hypothetical protein [Bacteroidota bacterium]